MNPKTYPSSLLLALALCAALPGNTSAQTGVTDTLVVLWDSLPGVPVQTTAYAKSGERVFCVNGINPNAGNGNLFYSDDNGGQWTKHPAFDGSVNHVVANEALTLVFTHQVTLFNNGYFQVHDYGIHRSTDGGETFQQVFDLNFTYVVSPPHPASFGEFQGHLLADSVFMAGRRTNGGYNSNYWINYVSTDAGATWTGAINANKQFYFFGEGDFHGAIIDEVCSSLTPDFADESCHATPGQNHSGRLLIGAARQNGVWYLCDTNGLLHTSSDEGITWLTDTLPPALGRANNFRFHEGHFYLSTMQGLFRSGGIEPEDWQPLFQNPFAHLPACASFQPLGTDFWLDAFAAGSVHSPDGGQTWTVKNEGLTRQPPEQLLNVGNQLWARKLYSFGMEQMYAFFALQPGGNWLPVQSPGLQGKRPVSFFFAHEGNAWMQTDQVPRPLLHSDDNGLNWQEVNLPLSFTWYLRGAAADADGRIWFWDDSNAVFTEDLGQTWTERPLPPGAYYGIRSLASRSDWVLMGGRQEIFRSTDLGQTWQETPLPLQTNYYEFFQLGGDSVAYFNGDNGKSWFSDNAGADWTPTGNGFLNPAYSGSYNSWLQQGRHILAQTPAQSLDGPKKIFITDDLGATWTLLDEVPGYGEPVISGDYLCFAHYADGAWRTAIAPLLPPSNAGQVRVSVFKDLDGDCQQTATDKALVNKPVRFDKDNQHFYALTGTDGSLQLSLPPGAYTLTLAEVANYLPGCGAGLSTSIEVDSGAVTALDFPFSPIPGIEDLQLTLTPPASLRPGFPAAFLLTLKNTGTETVAAPQVEFTYPHPLLSWLGSQPEADGQSSAGLAVFTMDSMPPEACLQVYINLQLVPDASLIGDSLPFSGNIPLTFNDLHPDNNSAAWLGVVTGSYDPNDKTSFPPANLLPLTANTMQYLVRFQNTGTDTAFEVVVIDTFDARFDLLTLQTIAASHDFDLTLQAPGIARWTFTDILLPDSTTNETASHGFVHFSIKTKDDVVVGDSLRNDAAIYFDFNEPVFTNEVLDEVQKGVFTEADSVIICPGDEYEGVVYQQSATLTDSIIVGAIWDSVYVTEIIVLPAPVVSFPVDICEGGTFEWNGVTYSQTGSYEQVFQSQNGCDSTVMMALEVHLPDSVGITFELCGGDTSPYTGIVYEWQGEYEEQFVLQNQFGCDSTVSASVVVHQGGWIGEGWGELPYGSVYMGVVITGITFFTVYDTTEFGCVIHYSFVIYPYTGTEDADASKLALKIFPNPVSEEFHVTFSLPHASEIAISLHDPLGRQVAVLQEKTWLGMGEHAFQFDAGGLANGVYLLEIQADGIPCSKTILKF